MTQGVNIAAAQNFNPQNAGGNSQSFNPADVAALLALAGASAFTDTSASTGGLESKFGMLVKELLSARARIVEVGGPGGVEVNFDNLIFSTLVQPIITQVRASTNPIAATNR